MRRYWFIALLLHAGLFTILLVRFDWWEMETPQAPAAIQAVVIDETKLQQPKNRTEEERARQEQQRIEKERLEQEQALKLKQQEIERQKAAQEEKRKREEQIKREKAEQQKKIELEKEKRRKEEEQRRKAEEEAKRKKLEQEKRKQEEAERKKAEAEKRRREAERKRREEALKSQLAAEEEFLEGEAQRKNQALIARYMARIRAKVESKWLEPPTARPGMSCEVRIRLSPSGEVLVVVTVTSSGNSVFDRSVEAAVQKASPLPLPSDPAILPGFPELKFNFKK